MIVAALFGPVVGLARWLRRVVLRAVGVALREDVLEVLEQVRKVDRRAAERFKEAGRPFKQLDRKLVALLAQQSDLQSSLGRVNRAIDARLREVEEGVQRTHTYLLRTRSELLGTRRDLKDQLGGRTKGMEGRLRHIERNVNAIVRHAYVDSSSLPFPQKLLSQRFHLTCQNEEDGLTHALFNEVGVVTRRFVDIGAGVWVNGGNTGFLAETLGWHGLMVESNQEQVDELGVRFRQFGIQTIRAWVTAENLNDLLEHHGFTGEIDLLSIDIDGNEYWLWESLKVCSPRVVIVEFNPSFGWTRSVVVRYDPTFDLARYKSACPTFHGASLGAFVRLASTLGYRLVLVEPLRGVNAYFIRQDVGVSIPTVNLETLNPIRTSDEDQLFEVIARNGLPLIDLDEEPEAVVLGE